MLLSLESCHSIHIKFWRSYFLKNSCLMRAHHSRVMKIIDRCSETRRSTSCGLPHRNVMANWSSLSCQVYIIFIVSAHVQKYSPSLSASPNTNPTLPNSSQSHPQIPIHSFTFPYLTRNPPQYIIPKTLTFSNQPSLCYKLSDDAMINPTRCKSGSSTLFPPVHDVRVLNTSVKLLRVNHTFLGLLKNVGIANLLELEFLWLLDSMSMARFHDSCIAVSYVGDVFGDLWRRGKRRGTGS